MRSGPRPASRDRRDPSPAGRVRPRGGSRTALLALAAAVLLLVAVAPAFAQAEPRTVRVGVYQNEPKIFQDRNGTPSGIFIDLLEKIAADEGWTLVYVPGEWSADLDALESGGIDLMPDVAYSPERDLEFDFHKTPVVESWSFVFARPGLRVQELSDLEGKRVAVLKDSIQESVFKRMVEGFGLHVTMVPVDSLDAGFAAARAGTADAAIANRLFGDYFYRRYDLVKTPIVFSPAQLFFATAEGRNRDLLDVIDRHLVKWIAEPDSDYYRVLRRWSGTPEPEPPYPLYWALGIVGGLLALAAAIILALRWQVRARTRHLEEARGAHRRSEELLQLALDAAHEGVWEWRADGGEITLSDSCFTTLGYEPGEFTMDDRRWARLLYPEDTQMVAKAWDWTLAGNDGIDVEFRIRAKDGSWRWVAAHGQAVERDPEGRVTHVLGTAMDVQARKEIELELRQHRENLEELVIARTRQLADANAAKSNFLAAMSHELRTPLNSIIGFSGVLLRGLAGPLDSEQRMQIDMIQRSGLHLLSLIDSILDLARLEAGGAPTRSETVEPVKLLDEVVAAMQPLASEKGLDLRMEVRDDIPAIASDAARIRQVLLNLLGNAVKFTDAGSVEAGLGRERGRVVFTVTDTGRGISEEALEHIFEAFYQADGDDQSRGTGLGLAISREYAHLLGGGLTATSREGEGSSFTFWLPERK